MRLTTLILGAVLETSTASATTFTYVGTPLSPALQGGTGAKAIAVSFLASKAPAPGKCVQTLKLTKYADGARTLSSLRKDSFQIIHNGDTGPITFATLCLGKDGVTLNGIYEINLVRNIYPFTENYDVTNATGNQTDLLQYLVYSGAVPSISSDISATPGTWTITP